MEQRREEQEEEEEEEREKNEEVAAGHRRGDTFALPRTEGDRNHWRQQNEIWKDRKRPQRDGSERLTRLRGSALALACYV